MKIYKTSILSFKDRARYIKGEHRFEAGFSRNPRKMVQLWAEKEYRNLKRIHQCLIPCPKPIFVRQNVLLMTLIGCGSSSSSSKQAKEENKKDEEKEEEYESLNENWSLNKIAAPLLKDCLPGMTLEMCYDVYFFQVIKYMRVM